MITYLKRTILLGFLLAAPSFLALSQRPYADSLKNILAHTKDPNRRVDLLCDIAYDLVDFNDDEAERLARQALTLAGENRYQAGKKYALTIIGLSNFTFGDYPAALKNLNASKNIKSDGHAELAGYNLMLMGSTHRDLANYDSAEFYYSEAIKTVSESGDPYYLGFFYRGLAHLKIIQWKNNEALDLLAKAESFAQKKPGDFYVLMNIWDLYGRVYEQLLHYKKSDYYFQKMCKQEEKNRDFLQRIKCYLHESTVNVRNGDLTKALQNAFKALEVSDIYRYPQQRVEVYTQIGHTYSELSQNTLATQYYLEGIKIGERHNLRYETANLYAKLAWVYKEEMNFKMAHEYLDKSEILRRAIGDQHGVSECQNFRGLVYFLQKDYDKSLVEFNKSLAIRKVVGNELNVNAILFNKSLVYEAVGKNDSALFYQLKSVEVEEKYMSRLDLGISYNGLALLMIKMKKFKEAEAYLKKSVRVSAEISSKFLRRNVYLNYAKFYEATGDLRKAIAYHSWYEALNDSIYSENSSLKLAEMQALYQVEKKEQEIRQLDLQKQSQEAELDSQKKLAQEQRIVIILSMVSIAMLLVAGVAVYRSGKEKSRDNVRLQKLNAEISEQKEEIQAQSEELIEATETISNINRELEVKVEERTSELKQAYKELDTFFYRSSHDFRRPITTFLGLAGVAKITVKDTVSLELFEKVSETAESLDRMLQKLQSISDVGAQQMVYKEVFIKELANEVLDTFGKLLQQKRITIRLDIKEQHPLVSYPAMVKIIIENLIENSIHFAGTDNPYISVRALVSEDTATIEVEDNGQGIEEEYKSRIFEMYFRANEHSKGNGLGLYIARKATEKLNGHIQFRSKHLVGTLFTVNLPNRKE